MNASVLDGARHVSGIREGRHQAECGARVEGVEHDPSAAHVRRHRELTPRRRCGSQPIERVSSLATQPGSLARRPLLELGRRGYEEAVEKRALISPDGCDIVSARERLEELSDVRRDATRVESDIAPGNKQAVVAQRPARVVQRLGQRVSRAFTLGLRPQKSQKFVATRTTFAVGGQCREQREQATLSRSACERYPIPRHVHGAKRMQRQHKERGERVC